MKYDEYGQSIIDSRQLFDYLYQKPDISLHGLTLLDPQQYNSSVDQLHLDWPRLGQYQNPNVTVEEFDHQQQSKWFIPDEYKDLDIAAWVIGQCRTEKELDRAATELLLFQERNLFPLLVYLKYLVDTMRQHGIVWGVGRGSSVASYVLYLIGIHRINSLEFELDIREFLKDSDEKSI